MDIVIKILLYNTLILPHIFETILLIFKIAIINMIYIHTTEGASLGYV